MKNLRFLALIILSATMFVSCSDDDDNPEVEGNSIVDVAISTPSLSSFTEALEVAGLTSTFDGSGTFTVFAPTNDAFQELLDSNSDWSSLGDIPVATLGLVLKYHVLATEVPSSALSDTYVNTLAMAQDESISLQVKTTGGVAFDGNAMPVRTDIDADNGIIHVVDKVMLPNNIVDFALDNPNFSTLVAALTDDRHTTNFVEVLSGDGPFTVFAPTNTAFQALLDSNSSWNALGDIPIATLEAVLKYHVVAGANVQSDQLTDDMTITTLGGDLTTDLSDGVKLDTTSGQGVNIILADVQGTNGVIHAVDQVLLP